MSRHWFHSPGWFGLRLGRCYWVLCDVRRHKLLYSERNDEGGSRFASIGPWELWLK
jgi:hypothetical protein